MRKHPSWPDLLRPCTRKLFNNGGSSVSYDPIGDPTLDSIGLIRYGSRPARAILLGIGQLEPRVMRLMSEVASCLGPNSPPSPCISHRIRPPIISASAGPDCSRS